MLFPHFLEPFDCPGCMASKVTVGVCDDRNTATADPVDGIGKFAQVALPLRKSCGAVVGAFGLEGLLVGGTCGKVCVAVNGAYASFGGEWSVRC